MNVGSVTSRTNALTGVGKAVPVLEDQEMRRGPATVSAPVSAVGTPGAKIVEADRAQRAADVQAMDVNLQPGIGSVLDVRA